jgi:hypothetical protein
MDAMSERTWDISMSKPRERNLWGCGFSLNAVLQISRVSSMNDSHFDAMHTLLHSNAV